MNQLLNAVKSRMNLSFERLSKEYSNIQVGRVSPSILDKVFIDYYGSQTPIQQVAAISVSEARILVVQPWDISLLSAIEKAIQKSDLGVNPQNDGKVLRLIFPQVNEERRRSISKDVSAMAENAKVSIRNIRRDALDKLKNMKKNSQITEDEQKSGEKKIQDLTDKFCKDIELLCNKKTTQGMSL